MIDDPRIAAVEGAQEVDDVGKVAGCLGPLQQGRAARIGMSAAPMFGHAGEQPIANAGAACLSGRN
jgi:hypothetical protein